MPTTIEREMGEKRKKWKTNPKKRGRKQGEDSGTLRARTLRIGNHYNK
jgi:hypothetical protein